MSNEVQAALIGALIAGVLTLTGILLTSHVESRRMREETRKRDDEWRREKCNEAYSQAIYYLFKLEVSSQSQDINDKDVRQHLSEAQRFLTLLTAYHPHETIRKQLGAAALSFQPSAVSKGDISARAAQARNVVEQSLHSTFSPTIR